MISHKKELFWAGDMSWYTVNPLESHIDEDAPQDPSQAVSSTGTVELQFFVCK